MFRQLVFCLTLSTNLLFNTVFATAPQQKSAPGFVGGQVCAGCHQQQYQDWKQSHHDLAMQEATEVSVLGDFNNTTFTYNSNTTFTYNSTASRFYRKGAEFWINTDGPAGKLEDFRVEYVFGVHPLQQYLLSLPGGRLNALSIAWDDRAREEGGQRWFHLYPEATIDAKDPLHWSGHYQNWNTRCAECHSTNLQKHYDAQTQTFSTTWTELNVSCEACHGPGKDHSEQAKTGAWKQDSHFGLELDLGERKQWQFNQGEATARSLQTPEHSQQVDSCGRCHSRRGNLGDYQYNQHLLDTHRLSLLEEPLYHSDGQILDEVYVYGSFVQSKMYQAGVVCSDCHNPHSNELRAPGNGVCAQCHKADVYDTEQHHRHPANSSGAQCANCHMPETTYMVVDPRRDHSMRVPRPDLSVVIGTPNVCNQCHVDKNADWALSAVRGWGIEYHDTSSHPARAIHQARRGDARAIPGLQTIAQNTQTAPISRATAMVAMGQFGNQEAYQTALQLLQSTDPLLRLSAVRALEFLPPRQRFRVLSLRVIDPSKAVRMETARLLADVPLAQLDSNSQKHLATLFGEYIETLTADADMPGIQLQLGIFYGARQQWHNAETAYRQALAINSQFVPALLNLADLYRSSGRDGDAREWLNQAIEIAPGQGSVWHALGLLETRAGNREAALTHLGKAAELEQAGVRHRYVYAIALHDSGKVNEAIEQLKAVHRAIPENLDILLALINYCQGAGRLEDARRYAASLKQQVPDNPQLNQLLESLR